MKPHKYAELIKAWADGAEIQFKEKDGWTDWIHRASPAWTETTEYRIKPEPKPDVYCMEYFYLTGDGDWACTNCHPGNLKLTFDGETGELKSAEVMK